MPSAKLAILNAFLQRLDPTEYADTLGFQPFDWQMQLLGLLTQRRLMLNCARQSGKSTITALLAWRTAKNTPHGLILIFAPTERQSRELGVKLMDFAAKDPQLRIEGTVTEKHLSNGCRVMILPGTERSIRGFSGPDLILIDEASRTDDALYRSVRPMMVGAETILIAMSTPFGQQGWFYDEWEHNDEWAKVLVKAPVDISVHGEIEPVVETEAQFAERMLDRGIFGYYSPRHTLEFMREEWKSYPEWWFRQEYMGEFLEPEYAAFTVRDLERAVVSDLKEMEFIQDKFGEVRDLGFE